MALKVKKSVPGSVERVRTKTRLDLVQKRLAWLETRIDKGLVLDYEAQDRILWEK